MTTTTKPNLFIVGAAKSGTTAMYRYLEQHPDIFVCTPKEPHHFGEDIGMAPDWRVDGRDAYEALFTGAGRTRWRGEASVFTMVSEAAAREISDYAGPEARVIAMLRDPVTAIWSLHWQFLKSANETLESLEDALDAEAERAEGRSIPYSAHCRLPLRYRNTYSYPPQLRRLFDAFGRERVHVELFDDLRADVEGVYDRCMRFLDLDASHRPDLSVVNAAGPIRNLAFRRAIQASGLKRVWGRVPPGLRRRAGDLAQLVTRDTKTRAQLRPETAAALAEHFEPQRLELESMLGVDLSRWTEQWRRLSQPAKS